jgi:hypothetical protein
MTSPSIFTSAVLAAAALALHLQAQAQAVLTLAEQPVRLIRGAAVYKGVIGSAVQRDDIIETGATGAQIESGKHTIIAVGPQTRLFVLGVADGKAATELALLSGWIKVSSHAPKRALVTTPGMQVTLPQGAAIVQAKAGRDAMFAEEGAQQAARVDEKGKAGTPVKLAAEQFATLDPAKPQLLVGRPSRDFIGEMPRSFRDRLVQAPVPPAVKAGKVAPVKERDVSFADVDDWMLSTLPVRRNFVSRFKVRLSDPEFKTALDQALGQTPEWRFLLRPSVTTGSTIY